MLIVNEKRKSIRTAKLVEVVVNARFSRLKGVDREGLANAKSDQVVILNVPANYHQNQYRFFQVVENLAVIDNPQLRAARLEKWGKELLDPRTAGQASLRLEGIGRNAVETLKRGLTASHPQVRFFAAEALAYVGDDSGVSVLAETTIGRPEFRAYALAALAALDEPSARLKLRELMAGENVEVRYGAFNALRTAYADDPYLGRVRVLNDEPEPDLHDNDGMAIQIATPRRRRKRAADPFALYVVDCDGPFLVHMARNRRCEIVIFGKSQTLLAPAVLSAGPIQVTASDGDPQVLLSRVGVEAVDGRDQKVASSPWLGEVVRAAANLGASYPEILSLLQAADRQKNLAGPLVVDAVPAALAAYDQAQVAGIDATKKDDAVGRASFETEKKKPSVKGPFGRLRSRFGR